MITYYAHSLCKHPAAFMTLGHTGTHWDTLGHTGTHWDTLVAPILGIEEESDQMVPAVQDCVCDALHPSTSLNNKMENVDQCCLRSPLLARPTRATDGMINAQLWRTSVGVLPRRGEHRHCEPVSESVSVVCHHTESEWQYWRWFPAGLGQARQSEF